MEIFDLEYNYLVCSGKTQYIETTLFPESV